MASRELDFVLTSYAPHTLAVPDYTFHSKSLSLLVHLEIVLYRAILRCYLYWVFSANIQGTEIPPFGAVKQIA